MASQIEVKGEFQDKKVSQINIWQTEKRKKNESKTDTDSKGDNFVANNSQNDCEGKNSVLEIVVHFMIQMKSISL